MRHLEGRIHGFVVLRDQSDRILASGDLQQFAGGGGITNELVLRFKDGSTHTETAVFSQGKTFQLLSYRLVQKGPVFKRPADMTINGSSKVVTLRYTDEDGKEKTVTEQMKLQPDVANGMVPTLVSDIDFKSPKTVVSMVAPTNKPRLVKLEITPDGEDSFSVAGSSHKAMVYRVKVEIGGVAGVVAPIVGKQPPDTRIWVVGGKAAGFVKSEGPLFEGGPVWTIEMASPVWPKETTQQSGDRGRGTSQPAPGETSASKGAR